VLAQGGVVLTVQQVPGLHRCASEQGRAWRRCGKYHGVRRSAAEILIPVIPVLTQTQCNRQYLAQTGWRSTCGLCCTGITAAYLVCTAACRMGVAKPQTCVIALALRLCTIAFMRGDNHLTEGRAASHASTLLTSCKHAVWQTR
jgi:hypothetical protein